MPRRTPVKELQQEEPVPSSPLRRSSRLSVSSPVPTKVISRRNSATESSSTSTPKVTRGRRSSFDQDTNVDPEPTKKISKTKASSEDEVVGSRSKTRGSSVPKEAEDVKKVTTRTRSVSAEPEPTGEDTTKPTRRTRSGSVSKTKEQESASVPSVTTPVKNDPSNEEEPNTGTKKKKTDFDLSVINETSLTEEEEITQQKQKLSFTEEIDIKASETVSPVKKLEEQVEKEAISKKRNSKSPRKSEEEEIKKPLSPVVKLSQQKQRLSFTEDNGIETNEIEVKKLEQEVEKEAISKKRISKSPKQSEEEMKKILSPVVKLSQHKQKLSFTEDNGIKADETEVKKREEQISKQNEEEMITNISPVIKLAKDPNVEKHYEKEKTPKKSEEEIKNLSPIIRLTKDNNIEDLIHKETTSRKNTPETLFSNSEDSFSLQLSSSIFENTVAEEKTEAEANKSPSNKENVRPVVEVEVEPMEVDEFEVSVTSTIKTVVKRPSIFSPLEVGKKLAVAEKITDQIAHNLSAEIRSSTQIEEIKVNEKSLDENFDSKKKNEDIEEEASTKVEAESKQETPTQETVEAEIETFDQKNSSKNSTEIADDVESRQDLIIDLDVEPIDPDTSSTKAQNNESLRVDSVSTNLEESRILFEESLTEEDAAEKNKTELCDNDGEKIEDLTNKEEIDLTASPPKKDTSISQTKKEDVINVEDSSEESEDSFIVSHDETYKSPVKKPGVRATLEDSVTTDESKHNDSIIITENVTINKNKVEDTPNKSLSQSFSRKSVDKTSIVIQENVKAGDKSLNERIHKVVDIFCSGIKSKADVSINVSLEYMGQVSDAEEENTEVLEISMSAKPKNEDVASKEQIIEPRGSKRRKIIQESSENEDLAEALDTSKNSIIEDTVSKTIKKSPKKKAEEEIIEDESSSSNDAEMESFVDAVVSESETDSEEEETDDDAGLLKAFLSTTQTDDELDNTWVANSIVSSDESSEESDDDLSIIEENLELSVDNVFEEADSSEEEEETQTSRKRKVRRLTNFLSQSLIHRADEETEKRNKMEVPTNTPVAPSRVSKKNKKETKQKTPNKKETFISEEIADMVPQISETEKPGKKRKLVAAETSFGVSGVPVKKKKESKKENLKPSTKSNHQLMKNRRLKPSSTGCMGWAVQMLK